MPDALSWIETKVVVPQSENSNVLLERRGGGPKKWLMFAVKK